MCALRLSPAVSRKREGGERNKLAELIIGFQRIATGCDKFDHPGKGFGIDRAIGQGRTHLVKQIGLAKRRGTSTGHDMLRQDIIGTGAEDFAIAHALLHRIERGLRLEIFETVAGNEKRLAGFVHPVVRPADTLQQPRASLGRAHLNHAIDIAPVNAEIQAGGANKCAQLASCHRALNLAPRLYRQRSMMYSDRIFGIIRIP